MTAAIISHVCYNSQNMLSIYNYLTIIHRHRVYRCAGCPFSLGRRRIIAITEPMKATRPCVFVTLPNGRQATPLTHFVRQLEGTLKRLHFFSRQLQVALGRLASPEWPMHWHQVFQPQQLLLPQILQRQAQVCLFSLLELLPYP